MRFVVKVSKKGQIVIPAEIRRKYGIRDRVVIRVEEDGLKIIPLIPLKELHGIDGEAMKEVAKEIVKERKEEIKLEEQIRV